MKVREQLITPDQARTLLLMSRNCRKLSPQKVQHLAEEMASGHWQFNGETIKFDVDGCLVDGQHRLMAVIGSGVSIRTHVVYGISPEAVRTVDLGDKRKSEAVLGLDKRESQIYNYLMHLASPGSPHVYDLDMMAQYFGVLGKRLIEHCGTIAKGFSQAPVRAAAVMAMETGEREEFVLNLYRDMVLMRFDAQPPAGMALSKLLNKGYEGKMGMGSRLQETYIRSRYVFTERNKLNRTIRITPDYRQQVMESTRSLVREIISQGTG